MEISSGLSIHSAETGTKSTPRVRQQPTRSAEGLPREETPEKMGEFKDKKGLEETTDLKIGPDIRFALRSRNPAFLKRILWGPLTVAEYREVRYRLMEIHEKGIREVHLLSGKITGDQDENAGEGSREEISGAGGGVDISV